MRNLKFSNEGWDDYLDWQGHDKKTLRKINDILKEVCRTPYTGVGKPEALKHNYSGLWSRRIDEKNRLVYKIKDDQIVIFCCRDHYA